MKKIYILLSFCLIQFIAQAQTIPAYLPTNGLVGWWPFNGNANDESGNGNHGIVNGATLTTDRNGNVNSAYSFDGLSNYISTTDIDIQNSSSITVWVYPLGTIGSIVDKTYDQPYHSGICLIYNNSTNGLYAHTGWSGNPNNNIFPTPSYNLQLGHWQHIVFVINGGTVNIYINGGLVYTQTNVNAISQNDDVLLFGKAVWGGNLFSGQLDDIAIYNRALTQQEITALYQAQTCSLSISSQPSNQNITLGNNTSFNVGVTATNCNSTSYQWQTNTGFGWQTLQNAGQYTGVNTSTLNVSNVNLANTNQLFRCLIQGGNITDTTQTATLSVVNTGNTNLSGVTHAIPYQAVVRDGAGNPLINHPLSVRCTLHDNTASGTSIYQETHTITTNNLGLFTLHIGTGVASIGNIDSIHWALYKKYLQVEFDTTAQGVSYIDLGTQQLMAVPYALYAETAGNALNAPKGDNGVDGVDGSNGADGINGSNGSNGVNGVNGSNGADGVSVTSANITNDSLYLSLSNSQTINAGKLSGGLPNGTAAGEMMYWNGTAWVSVAAGVEGQSLSFHNGTPTWESRLSVGMQYQGGVIAYLLHQGDIGYDPNVQHGLIAAPFDQSTGAQWGCYGTTISGADGTAIGTGNQNTIDIMNGCSTAGIAARICGDLVLNGYSDWYLPSKDELAVIYSNKGLIGGFAAAYYWSSSEISNVTAWYQYFNFGLQFDPGNGKSNYGYVRAVRAF
jgi:hypothetical protein